MKVVKEMGGYGLSRKGKRFISICTVFLSLFLFLRLSVDTTTNVTEIATTSIHELSSHELEMMQNLGSSLDNTPVAVAAKLRLYEKLRLNKKKYAKEHKRIYRDLFPWLKFKAEETSNNRRGIVMCLGDNSERSRSAFSVGYSAIQMIRRVWKSDIAIQVYYIGGQDLSLQSRENLLKIRGVTVHDLEDYFDNESLEIKGYDACSNPENLASFASHTPFWHRHSEK